VFDMSKNEGRLTVSLEMDIWRLMRDKEEQEKWMS
jgi:hypothetical protein